MTSSVWHRLVLRQVHGVRQEEVYWVTTAPERMGALGMPPGVDVRQDTTGRSTRDLMLAGEIDAMMSGRPSAPGSGPDEPVAAFPDLVAAQRDYYRKTGMFPIMHLVAMKEELAAKEPWLVESLCDAFTRAKDQGREEALGDPRDGPIAGGTAEDARALLGDDPWPYGLGPSRDVLQTFLNDVRDQGLLERPLAVEDLFASNLPARYR
jgi:4,5-dihydroxyphthalate decarboxylase